MILARLVATWRQAVHLALLVPVALIPHRDLQRAPPVLLAHTRRVLLDLAPVAPRVLTPPQEPLLVFLVLVVLMPRLDRSPARLVRLGTTLVRHLVPAQPVQLAHTQLMEDPRLALKSL